GGFGGGGGGGWISSARGGAGGGYTGGDASANSSYGGSSFVHATGWDAANTPGGNAGGAPGKLVITLHYGMATARRTPGSLGCGPTPMTIRAVGGARPQLGTSFVSEVAQVPATAVLTSVGMGLSQTSTGGVPLPFDLGLIGAPACTLYNDLALGAVFATTPSGGNAFRHTFAIPTDVILAGMPVYQQGWSLVPGANPLQILTSDQLELVLGY
ncbi:MAG: hypothetical protein KAI24_24850, partial [Planctomycetes bacterium]|nr:hypothetical protein [Planctomycetota bacterium]